jgi:hypothetical protein
MPPIRVLPAAIVGRATLADHIVAIVLVGAGEQMMGIYAPPVVAAVADQETIGDGTVVHHICEPMR